MLRYIGEGAMNGWLIATRSPGEREVDNSAGGQHPAGGVEKMIAKDADLRRILILCLRLKKWEQQLDCRR